MRVGVLDIAQNPHLNQPTRFVSKNAAAALVRRLVAIHITKHLIQMVEVRPMSSTPLNCARARYIPEKMPPREVPNCYFQPPQSETWRLQHKTVSFMPREY